MFQEGETVYCRCPLQQEGMRSLERGQRGVVKHVFQEELLGNCLCTFEDNNTKHDCVIPEIWLEQSPGTFCLGLQRILESPGGFYRLGPIVSDLRFPEPHQLAYPRYNDHCRTLMRSGFGFSFYEGINALNIGESMSHKYGYTQRHINLNPDHLGLMICEHPWTRGDGDRWAFLAEMARSFLTQYSTIPKILSMRVSDWKKVETILTRNNQRLSRRIQVLKEDRGEFQPHYTPLRHFWDSDERDEILAKQVAIIFHPHTSRRFQFAQPLHVPECVLKAMFQKRRSLFLAAGTCESQIEYLNYFLRQLKEHHILS